MTTTFDIDEIEAKAQTGLNVNCNFKVKING